MKLTQELYNQYKKTADMGYMQMYGDIMLAMPSVEDMKLDEQEALTIDLMLSNILGTVTSFDHVHALLKAPTTSEIIADLETIIDGIESDTYTADNIADLIAKLKK